MAKKAAKKATAPAKPAAAPEEKRTGGKPSTRKRPIVQESKDFQPRVDPRTGKTEVPGQPGPQTKKQRANTGPLRVRATRMVYFEHKRRRAGDVFTLARGEQFNPKCMEWVDPRTSESITTGQQALKQHHDEELLARRGLSASPTSDAHNDDDDVR